MAFLSVVGRARKLVNLVLIRYTGENVYVRVSEKCLCTPDREIIVRGFVSPVLSQSEAIASPLTLAYYY